MTCQPGDKVPDAAANVKSAMHTMNNGRVVSIRDGVVWDVLSPPAPGRFVIGARDGSLFDDILCSSKTVSDAKNYIHRYIYVTGPGHQTFEVQEPGDVTWKVHATIDNSCEFDWDLHDEVFKESDDDDDDDLCDY